MAEAMARIRAELGEEAVILSSTRVAGGVEIIAGLEPPEAEPLPAPPPPPVSVAPLFQPLPDAVAAPLLLLGPHGGGKTLTLAKLATRMAMAGQAPLLVAADAARAGAVAQLAAFAAVLGLDLAVAETPAELARALARRRHGQPVLVDTAGCDLLDLDSAEALVGLRRIAEANVALVMPAGLDAAEALDTARAARAIGARWMLPTRLDAARRWAGWLGATTAAGLALDLAGTGPGVADGLTCLTPDWLAARIRLADPRTKAAA